MRQIEIQQGLREIVFLVLPATLLLANGFYLFFSIAMFIFIFILLQQKNKPGVFTFILVQHTLQIITGVILCNYLGKDINFRSPSTATVTIISTVGLLFLFTPMIYFQSRLPNVSREDLVQTASRLSTDRVLRCYLGTFFITSSLGATAHMFPGLTQMIISAMKIKWFFFLLLGFLCILKNEKKRIFYMIIAAEFLSGFLGFFSEFKTVIFFLLILVLSMTERLTARQFFIMIVVACGLGGFAVLWNGVKGEYRTFLNQGEKNQSVLVSREDALNKLYDLSNKVDMNETDNNLYGTLERLQYTHYFSLTMDRVPSVLPHTDGQDWLDNLLFVTTPRFLNPNKPNYDPTSRARKYTGRMLSGLGQGASFSLGYFAECFIDFGLYGMMFPLFVIGMLYGLVYFYFMRTASKNLLLNYAMVGAFFWEFNAFEMDGAFLLGRFFTSLVTFLFLLRFVFPYIIDYITIRDWNPAAMKVFR